MYALQTREYSCWQKQTAANSILFKEPGNIRIHRTRVIHFYKADFNVKREKQIIKDLAGNVTWARLLQHKK